MGKKIKFHGEDKNCRGSGKQIMTNEGRNAWGEGTEIVIVQDR